MDTRKVTFIATIAAVILVAVGIGFAYTAATSNSGNNASPEYVTLVQDGTGAYQFSSDAKILWNSTDYKTGAQPYTDFTVAAASAEIPGMSTATFKAVALGNPFDLVAHQTNGSGFAATETVVIDPKNVPAPMKDEGGNIVATVVFHVSDGTHTTYLWVTAADTLTQYNAAGEAQVPTNQITMYRDTDVYSLKTATITAYYMMKAGTAVTVAHVVGEIPSLPIEKPLENSSLTFSISNGSFNPGTHVAVNGLTLDKERLVVKTTSGAQTVNATVTAEAGTPTDETITAFSVDSAVATVSVSSANVITITPVAVGSTTVVVTTHEGGFSKVIEVEVGNNLVTLTPPGTPHFTVISGDLTQAVGTGVAIAPIVLKADDGYTFTTYTVAGLTATVNGSGAGNTVTISGIPAADVTQDLAAATAVSP